MSQTKAQLVVGLNVNASAPASALQIDASGNINLDSNTLYVDAANNRVGIGTSSPSTLIHGAVSSGSAILRLENTANSGESSLQLYGKNSGGTVRTANIKYDNSDYFRIGTPAAVAIAFETSDTERLRITSAGNVGIGSTAPSSLLTLNAASNPALEIDVSNTKYADFIADTGSNVTYLESFNGYPLAFSVASGGGRTERVRIDTSGRLLVGTSSARSVAGQSHLVQFESANSSPFSGVSIVNNANDGNGSYLILGKSRGTSAGSNTVVQNGDQIGGVFFAAADGSNINGTAASITCNIDAAPGTNDVPGRLVFSTTADGASSPTERMRITNDGALKVSDNGTYNNATNTAHEINNSGTSAALQLFGRHATTPNGYFYRSTAADPNNTTQYVFKAEQNTGGNIYTIWSNGTVTARSDARYKKNIETTRDGYLEDLSQLRVVKYNWYNHEDDAPKELGFIAQEVEQIFPGLVMAEPEKDEDGNETGEVCKSIKFSVLTPMLVKALQEAHAKIEQLESRLTALEGA